MESLTGIRGQQERQLQPESRIQVKKTGTGREYTYLPMYMDVMRSVTSSRQVLPVPLELAR